MTPRLVLTLGLRGSASTWSYNVARELMVAACGADRVHACFAETTAALLAERGALGRAVVCKTHGFADLPVLAHLTDARIVATLRDPRDAVLSLMQRFGVPAEAAVRSVLPSCDLLRWCADAGHPVLRYEDRFFDAPATVDAISGHLGLPPDAAAHAAIFAAYRTDAVRAFAATVPDLPADRLVSDGRVFCFDRLTQIHRTHIGDAGSGKWRTRFDAPARAQLAHLFAPFLARFGYPAA